MWKPIAVSIVFACAVFSTNMAGAISFEARDFDALATEADQIVIGTAASRSARRTGAREIVTDFRFADIEVIKGAVAENVLSVTMLGGTVGTDTLTVAGAPTFKQGNRYLVFISGNGSVMFPLVGGDQGIFQLRKDAISGVSHVHDYAGRALTRLPGRVDRDTVASPEAGSGEPITEGEFVDAIRARLHAGGAK